MSTFDIVFWLLIVIIAVLAYTIESGLSQRHRTLVFSSILSATLAVVYMMFLVEDNSSFGTGTPPPKKETQKKKVVAVNMGGDGTMMQQEVEVVEVAPKPEDSGLRYEDSRLLKTPGGFRDCPECPLMIMIPAGEFIIGSPGSEAGRRSNESPQKSISFARPFTISRYEIQFRQFAAFVKDSAYKAVTPCRANGEEGIGKVDWQEPGVKQPTAEHPVVCLSWYDATAYAKWLSEKTDRRYRLPSEAEWEYVARAGTVTPYWFGADITPERANFGKQHGGTTPAGKFDDNPFEVFDVNGNVWEMTEDCWGDTLRRVPVSGVSELGAGDCARSPLRGGGWASDKRQVRSAYRRAMYRNEARNTVGFRLVREIK